MGSFRDYLDVAGGLRSGLNDEPPWWARGAIAVFAAVVVLAMGVSAVLGVGAGSPAEGGRRPPPATTTGAPAPVATAPGSTGATSSPVAGAGSSAPATAGGASSPVAGAGSAAESPAGGGDAGGARNDGGTVALADRDGTFQQVPRAAVTAAREYGARALGVPVAEVRHQLIRTMPGRVELTVSSLDGGRTVRVAAAETDGAWHAS